MRSSRVALLSLAVLAASCGRDVIDRGDRRAPLLSLEPAELELFIGQPFFVRAARVEGARTSVLTGPSVRFVERGGVVTLEPDGSGTAVRAGAGQIDATAGALFASTSVTVRDARAVALVVEPSAVQLAPGASRGLRVRARLDDGSELDVTRATSGTTYLIAEPSVATVSEDGSVEARAPGRTLIRVRLAGLMVEVPVVVEAEGPFVGLVLEPSSVSIQPGELRSLRAIALRRSGERVDVTRNGTRFSSSAPAVASVDADGTVVGRARGRAQVEVIIPGLRATAEVFVTPAGPFSLSFEPSSLDLEVGDVVTYALTQVFAGGVTADLTLDPNVVYTASPDAPFTVQDGRLSALRVGEGTLEARVGEVTARLSVVVRAPVVALRFEPDLIAVEVDGRTTFRVWAISDDGASVDVTADPRLGVTFDNPVLALIERPGTVFGRFEGTTGVLARFGGVMGRATLVVTTAREPILVITAPRQIPFSTPASYRVQRVEPGLPPIDVTADPRLVVRAEPVPALVFPEPGVLEGRRSGVAKLRAWLDGLEAEVEILVDPPPRARTLEFVPSSLALSAEQTVGVSLIATLADGTRLDVTYEPSVTFLARGSVSTAIETVSGLFSVRSRSAGSGSVTATYDGMTAVLLVTVTNSLIGLEVAPRSVRVEVGRTQTLAVTGLYDDGTRSQLLGASFSIADPTIARLSAFGALTGLAVGSTTVRVISGPLIVEVPVEVVPAGPVATTLQPDIIAVGSGDTVVALAGESFVVGDVVRIDAASVPTRFVSDQLLTFTVPAAALTRATTLAIDVTSPRGDSRVLPLIVGVPPQVTLASPNALVLGGAIPVTVMGLGLAGVVPSAPGLSFVSQGAASDGRWARWLVTSPGNGPPGPRTVTLSSPLGRATFTLDFIDIGTLTDLIVPAGQTLTLSGTQRVGSLRVEQGARVVAAGPEPLVIIAGSTIEVAGEILADGGAAGFEGGDAGGAGAGGGAGGALGVGSSGAGGRGTPMGQSAPANGFGGAGGGAGGGFGAILGCAGGGGGGFGGWGGDGGRASPPSGGAAGGLGSDGRGGTGGGGGVLCGGPTTMRNGSGGGGGGGGVIVLIAPFGLSVRVEATGVVSANGGAGGDVPPASALVGSGGGGGSGGRIELIGGFVEVAGIVRARGGRGGNGQGAGGGGGGGGGGNILIDTRPFGSSRATQLDVAGGSAGRGGPGLGSASAGGTGVAVVR